MSQSFFAEEAMLSLQGFGIRKHGREDVETTALEATRSLIYEALHNVDDPELGVNVVDLGLVYDVEVNEEGFVTLTMTLTTPGCPMQEALAEGVGAALGDIPGLTG